MISPRFASVPSELLDNPERFTMLPVVLSHSPAITEARLFPMWFIYQNIAVRQSRALLNNRLTLNKPSQVSDLLSSIVPRPVDIPPE